MVKEQRVCVHLCFPLPLLGIYHLQEKLQVYNELSECPLPVAGLSASSRAL